MESIATWKAAKSLVGVSFLLINSLDYTPFHCSLCSQSYCTEHRFSHGCDASRVFDPSIPSTSAPLRPFLCSKEVQRCFIQIRQVQNCSNGESISITCAHCDLNFCLRHRHPGQHNCQNEPKEAEKDLEIAERLRKMHEMLDPIVKREKKVYEQTENSERNKTVVFLDLFCNKWYSGSSYCCRTG